ncbi:MAG: DUF4290 domain-containing protein [Crocinitomicaceae bacterium]|nr:DUF4290 domain-containing protein [Crocinitomicaceae bacterium]
MQNKESLTYNTERPKMQIPEYGRNVQKLVDYAVSLTDRGERQKVVNAIIKVMGELNPHLRDVEEYKPKLWTHLFIISDFQLDVDSPYPIPEREKLSGKPGKVDYPQSKIKIGHYGKTVEKMIDKACEMEKGEEREALEKYIASLMKRFYLTFNDTSVEDEVILDHLSKLSDGQIQLSDTSFLPNTNEILRSTGGTSNKSKSKSRSKGKNRNKNRKRH